MGRKLNGFMWLSPYAWVLALRHKIYDMGLLRAHSFDFPVICVGNITVGGTGKTPVTEYLIQFFLDRGIRPVVLSRGYGRKTKGFRYVEAGDRARDVGDEPLQIKSKFPGITVAVREDRVDGIRRLCATEIPQVLILDDAFQHRRVSPRWNIVLEDYNRPVTKDTLMPFGRLRDLPLALRRAHCLIVTKCPPGLTEEEILQTRKSSGNGLPVFCSGLEYERPIPLRAGQETNLPEGSPLLVVTGIATPAPFIAYLKEHYEVKEHMAFPDHHLFTKNDFKRIQTFLDEHSECRLATTQKDAVRLTPSHLPGWVFMVKISFLTDRFRSFAESFCH